MDGNSVIKSGISGWAWIGIITGILLIGAVVVLVLKEKKDDEEVTERHTSEMVDQNLFK